MQCVKLKLHRIEAYGVFINLQWDRLYYNYAAIVDADNIFVLESCNHFKWVITGGNNLAY